MPPRLLILLALVVTATIYWTGLSGPFIFDDTWNLEPVRLWLDGQASLREVVFPQPSILLSRPVAMASFALTAHLFGDSSFSFKLGNLIVHLACGVLGWLVLRRALKRDGTVSVNAELLAAIAAAFWLLHPLHVSTVLYSVQRMAQLSTLFTLAAVLFYLVARQQLIDGKIRAARLNLFIGFPAMLVLGLLSKQNAAVAPAICLAFELAYFGTQTARGRAIPTFFGIFLVLPALAVIALLAISPDRLLSTYADWDFTLYERLLTQPRALIDYLGMLIFPRGPLMGLYTDDFLVSRGLLSPVSTVVCLLALVAISIVAIGLRKRAPSVFAGWFFFLVAHSVESGFLPLEMYYEHRNYLPSLGLLLALCGLIGLIPRFQTNVLSPRKLGVMAAIGFGLVLSVATLGRVLIWQDLGTIAQLGVKTHPESQRARLDVAVWALDQKDYETALNVMSHLTTSKDPRQRQVGHLNMAVINCMRSSAKDSESHLGLAAKENLPMLTTFEAQAFGRLAGATKDNGCGGLRRAVIAGYMKRILDSAASQPETAAPKWFARYALAEIYTRDNQWKSAQEQAELAWENGHDKKVGLFAAHLYIQNGRIQQATDLLVKLEATIQPYDKQGQAALAIVRQKLANAKKSPAAG